MTTRMRIMSSKDPAVADLAAQLGVAEDVVRRRLAARKVEVYRDVSNVERVVQRSADLFRAAETTRK